MKKKELLALVGAVCLGSCEAPDADIIRTGEKMYPFQFSLQLKKEILPFPSSRSIPEFSIPNPTGANSSPSTDDELYSKIEYIVYNCSESPEKLVRQKQFIHTDDDFGIIYDSLPAGSYKVAFLAHSSATATLNGSTMTFDKVSDTFHAVKALPVDGGAIIDNDIELKRIISRIEFIAEEIVPSSLKSLDIEVKPHFNTVDIFTGKSTAKADASLFPYQFTEDEKGKTGPAHSFYTFIPAGGETFSAILTTTTDNGTSCTRQVDNIVAAANKIIRYKGALYTPKNSDETFKLSILNNGTWNQPDSDIPLE